MWQALLAAAVAGSTGIVAKHLFNFKPTPKPSDYDHTDQGLAQSNNHDQDDGEAQGAHFRSSSPSGSGSDRPGLAHASVFEEQDGVFRFSSTDSPGGDVTGVRTGSKKKKKRGVLGGRKLKKERSGGGLEESSVRRFGVCLKRRKTGKNVAGKPGSCSSNDASLFGWGLGVGIMYMMSAGKVEFSKLNAAMGETAKVVQELKTELRKRKSSRNLPVAICASEVISSPHTASCKDAPPDLDKSRTNKIDPSDIKSFSPIITDGECASSVLTEEPGSEGQEMDQLEAELELELQKLPWCTIEASNKDGSRDMIETEISAQVLPGQERQDSETHQLCGVMPVELDQKLCHLLIERQETQIEELESELHVAQRKLHEKEAELQALKDCVKRLTEFSLSTLSDDETEGEIQQVQTRDWNYKKVGSESKEPGVGMKRPIDSKIV
ncbi:POLAR LOCALIZATION DURING ASYMMETRIC DIVISION AND protein [Parasponia andersonii]|uniref:POLAR LOCALIZATION DURING ASYMMETRIC DIVISION AND protein n=1 Tax=Parasponia andersonii TaxID=3476 RepID=A0A2P5D7M9_PARAD|nr:POLAR LOCALIZATION DURING ASYMMETRIC DIVISION AND protein [Parasponia andersonii]